MLLCLMMTTGTLAMSWQYAVYAYGNHSRVGKLPDGALKMHSIDLRNVFIHCGVIHILASVVVWFLPVYFVVSGLYFWNTVLTKRLNDSGSEADAFAEHHEALRAQAELEAMNRACGVFTCSQRKPADDGD